VKATPLIGAFGAAMLLGMAASARGQAAAAPVAPSIAGLWVVQDPGSGSFLEWFMKGPGPQAQVRPEVAKLNAAEDALLAAGHVTNTQPQTPDCPRGNLPLAWASSGIQELTMTPTEVRMTGEVIYLDGRPHPDIKSPQYVPSASGHAIGRWEGDTLVADLVGFPPKSCDSRYPNYRVPGGGRISDTTHLVQRFRLVDPDTLEIVFTWDDPKIYLKPHTYTYRFKRTVRPPEDPAQPTPKRKFLTDELWKAPPAPAK
jgi:hypothetical protein